LRVYREKYDPSIAIRTSLSTYETHGSLVDLPLYGLGQLGAIMQQPPVPLPRKRDRIEPSPLS